MFVLKDEKIQQSVKTPKHRRIQNARAAPISSLCKSCDKRYEHLVINCGVAKNP